MYEALPYKRWHAMPKSFPQPTPLSRLTSSSDPSVSNERGNMKGIVNENVVVVVARKGCCMTHVVRCLLLALGVNPAIYEVDEQEEQTVMDELEKMNRTGGSSNSGTSFPTVFVAGRWFGGLERIMATHITGELTPTLREAGALWL